jgi:hypothetical protein
MQNMSNQNNDEPVGFRDLQHMVVPVRHSKPQAFQAFPKMLTHPDHEDAVPARAETVVTEPPINSLELPTNEFVYTPAIPEKWPPRIVNNEAEEAAAVAEGYRAAPGGVQAPVEEDSTPHGYKPAPFPKWIAAHNRAVNSFEEELALMSPEERAAAEAERAKRKPVLTDFNDVERYTQAVVAWTMAQMTSNSDTSKRQHRAQSKEL